MVTGAMWLIGLGVVFLVREAMGLEWGETWPLFIVLAGVGTGVGALMAMAGRRIGLWAILWALLVPLIMVVVGVLLFVDLAGLADIDAFGILARNWPFVLIAIGVVVLIGAVFPGQRGVEERIEVPAAGVSSGEVILKFGAGQLDVTAGRPGTLVSGELEGGAIRRDLGPGRIELETDLSQVFPWVGDRQHWRLALAPDVPMRLRLEGGASRSTLDLADVLVTDLVVKTGASDTRIVLPRRVEQTNVQVEAGAAQVRIEVPAGVAARIRAQMGLGSTVVDETRFPRAADGWASPDYERAANRADIRVSGGVGSVRIG